MLCISIHGLRTSRSPDRLRSQDHQVSGPAWARLPRLAHTARICKDTHCLAFKSHGGSTHLLLQAHPCPGSSATFSNRFGLALFFWVVWFGFKIGAVQHALTYWKKTEVSVVKCMALEPAVDPAGGEVMMKNMSNVIKLRNKDGQGRSPDMG